MAWVWRKARKPSGVKVELIEVLMGKQPELGRPYNNNNYYSYLPHFVALLVLGRFDLVMQAGTDFGAPPVVREIPILVQNRSAPPGAIENTLVMSSRITLG